MHDIKLIRKNPDFFSKKIAERNSNIDIKRILDLDKKNRELIQNKEKLEQEKKIISQKQDKSLFKKSKEMSLKIDTLNKDHIKIKNEIDFLLSSLPNLATDNVPIGADEKSNKEIKKIGKVTKFDFKPSSHDQIGKKIGQIDFDVANKTSGSRSKRQMVRVARCAP